MKNYLQNLNERERWTVIFTFIVVFVYGYYVLLYSPLNNKVSQKSEELQEKNQTLAWMNSVRQEAHHQQKKQSVDNNKLLTLLASQLKESDTLKFPYQLQQTGSGEIQLTFASVPFNLFMKWLEAMDSKYVIHVKQFDVEPTDKPGMAKLMIILSA